MIAFITYYIVNVAHEDDWSVAGAIIIIRFLIVINIFLVIIILIIKTIMIDVIIIIIIIILITIMIIIIIILIIVMISLSCHLATLTFHSYFRGNIVLSNYETLNCHKLHEVRMSIKDTQYMNLITLNDCLHLLGVVFKRHPLA